MFHIPLFFCQTLRETDGDFNKENTTKGELFYREQFKENSDNAPQKTIIFY